MMAFLVQDLLDYAQIKAGKFRKNISKFDVRKTIESVMCVQRQKAMDNGIGFFPEYPNICDKEEEVDEKNGIYSPFVCTDEERVMQVLLGLQSNALKFTMQGYVKIQVKILVTNNERFLQVSVIDTGEGIAYED